MTGSRAQLYNGIVLLATFFSCRLVWGTYQSIRVYQDVWAAVHHTPVAASIHLDVMSNATSVILESAAGNSAAPLRDGIMRFAGEEYIPVWLGFTYLGSNVILNTLNFFWFGKMIDAVRKRFTPAKGAKKEKAVAIKSTVVNGTVKYEVDQMEIRRRKILDNDESITLT
jgi:TLC domain-containing protein